MLENGFRLDPVLSHPRDWERNPIPHAELTGEIAFSLDAHRFSCGTEDRHARVQHVLLPRRLRPVNRHRDHHFDLVLTQQRARRWMLLPVEYRAHKRRWVMAVIARQIGARLGASIAQNLRGAVGETIGPREAQTRQLRTRP